MHGKLPISKKTNLWNTDIDSKIITHTRLFLFQILVFTLFLISKLSLHSPLRKETKKIKKKNMSLAFTKRTNWFCAKNNRHLLKHLQQPFLVMEGACFQTSLKKHKIWIGSSQGLFWNNAQVSLKCFQEGHLSRTKGSN